MTIRFTCVECNSVMKIKDEKAGTTGHCPKCKKEFVVPQPGQEDATSTSAKATEAVEEPTEESLEDEYQRILMGDSPSKSATRSNGPDSDTFLTSDSSDEHPTSTSVKSETRSSVADAAAPKTRPRTTAEMADALINNTGEPASNKKTGKAFGAGKGDAGDVRAKAAKEARNYYLTRIGIGSAVVVVLCFGMYYVMSSMMGGLKYPPLGSVSGTIKLDGAPLAGAAVTFQPMQEGPKANTRIASSMGITDKAGHYTLQYVEGVQGAVVGKHIVQIRAQNDVGLDVVPIKYSMDPSSTLSFDVKAGSNSAADFDLTK
jgi:hypothetical protein